MALTSVKSIGSPRYPHIWLTWLQIRSPYNLPPLGFVCYHGSERLERKFTYIYWFVITPRRRSNQVKRMHRARCGGRGRGFTEPPLPSPGMPSSQHLPVQKFSKPCSLGSLMEVHDKGNLDSIMGFW